MGLTKNRITGPIEVIALANQRDVSSRRWVEQRWFVGLRCACRLPVICDPLFHGHSIAFQPRFLTDAAR